MSEIDLKYGRSKFAFEYDPDRFQILVGREALPCLSDAEIGEKLDAPVGSETIEEMVNPGETVLIVVPDATRQTACGQMVNILVRRLIANGTAAFDIRIIFATGIHRPVAAAEKEAILTPFIAQRIKTLDHGPRDIAQLIRRGETAGGIPVELNRVIFEHDHVVLVGGVTFHYFAGFTGGRKLICPGLGSSKTIAQTHKLAFDCDTRSRREGVDTALLDGNAVHEAFIEAAAMARPAFCISTIVNDAGEATDVFCGDWIASHRAACEEYSARNSIAIDEKRGLVIVSCGGSPHDINMVQAHKALEAASHACIDGGTIVLLAECIDGTGRADFLDWFNAVSSEALAERLCEKYQVNGQTAWSLLKKTEKFDVRIVTTLDESVTGQMKMQKAVDLEEALKDAGAGTGYILPIGASVRIVSGT